MKVFAFHERCLAVVVVLGSLAVGAGAVQARTIYVSTAGNDANSGLSWVLAKRTVSEGLDTAASGDQVWVAAGTYEGRIDLKVGVGLYGGFAGGETQLTQRNWVSHVTILLWGIYAPAGVTSSTSIDGFVIRGGTGIDCDTPSSLIIRNNIIIGTSTGVDCYPNSDGYSPSSPAIQNNAFIGNDIGIYCNTYSGAAIRDNTFIGNGIGIRCYNSSPSIANCIVAFNGTGISRDANSYFGTLSLRYNCAYGNTTNYSGFTNPTGSNGNISLDPQFTRRPSAGPDLAWGTIDDDLGDLRLTRSSPCIDAGNSSDVPAGVVLDLGGNPRVYDFFVPNTGLGVVDIGAYERCAVVFRVSTHGNDTADGSSWAKAKKTVQAAITAAATGNADNEVWVAEGTYSERITLRPYVHLYGGFGGNEQQRVDRNWRSHPTILDAGGSGSGVTANSIGVGTCVINGFTIRNGGAGIYCDTSSLEIANNTVTGNSQYGIYCRSSSNPSIRNNVISGNGYGIYCPYSDTGPYPSPSIRNSTICGNGYGAYGISGSVANCIVAFNDRGIDHSSPGGSLSLRYNCVYGNTTNFSGLNNPTGSNGNISADPKLVDAAYGNFHLQPTSPCINHGDSSLVVGDDRDIDNQSRIEGTAVDIGVDEFDGTTASAGPYVTVRVSHAGNDTNNGSTWATAKKTVQAAVNVAACVGADVWVADGVYQEQITLRPYVYIYGGFAGNEQERVARDWRSHPTILDAGGSGYVVTATGIGYATSALDGFTIRNGTKGVYCSPTSSPSIRNSTITGNSQYGIHCEYASPSIQNSCIIGNSGPGIYCGYPDNGTPYHFVPDSNPRIQNSIIGGNQGCGIYCISSNLSVRGSTISGNSLGIYFTAAHGCPSYSPSIANCIVAFNAQGVGWDQSTPSLRYNCVYGNTTNYLYLADPTGVDGNISVDPRLADPAYNDLHLQPDSRCINRGDSRLVAGDELDTDGQPRVQGTAVDIGADESNGTAWGPRPHLVVRVHPAGNDANDGSNWAAAKRTIQAAVNVAAGIGADVWVAEGTYSERIMLLPYVHVYGGFGGSETAPNQRNWKIRPAVLDGGGNGNVVTISGGSQGMSTLDGFAIRNGTRGIYCVSSSPSIWNTTISGNSECGIYCDESSPSIQNSTISGNGEYGIYCVLADPSLRNNTISSNGGYGIYCGSANPSVANCIVAFNGTGIYRTSTSSTLTLRYNCIYGNTTNYSGLIDQTGSNSNISADPRFVQLPDPGMDGIWGTADDVSDLHVLPDSPCIDAGNNVDVPADVADLDSDGNTVESLPVDLAGAARFVDDPYKLDTGGGTAPIVDMGAYEYRCGDTNGDGLVDVVDLLGVVYAFGTYGGDAAYDATCDFNADRVVDVIDLLDIVYSFAT